MPLAIGIQYLTGYAVASDASDRASPEWPPHPARVYMALAAAYFAGGESAASRSALESLERLPSPSIKAGEAYPRHTVTHYVPVNENKDPKKSVLLQSAPGIPRVRQPRAFPRVFVGDDPLFLIWPDVEVDRAMAEALDDLCRRVARLGHSSSLVQMWATTDLRGIEPTWIPDQGRGTVRMRTTSEGLLDHLQALYGAEERAQFEDLRARLAGARGKPRKAFQIEMQARFPAGPQPPIRPVIGVSHGYAPRGSQPASPLTTVFDPDLIVQRLVPRRPLVARLDLVATLRITEMLRAALLSAADPSIPEWLSGHDPNGGPAQRAHVAYLPLGFVGRRHADGHLLGVGVAVPRDLSADDRRRLRRLLAGVETLTLGPLGVWALEGVDPAAAKDTLRPTTWTAAPPGARVWSSVTPVALDRHPKSRDRAEQAAEIAATIRTACERMGAGLPEEVVVTAVSPHIGAPAAHEFPLILRGDGSRRHHVHAMVRFNRPVVGPLVIGAGRYRGYGLFRPMTDAELS